MAETLGKKEEDTIVISITQQEDGIVAEVKKPLKTMIEQTDRIVDVLENIYKCLGTNPSGPLGAGSSGGGASVPFTKRKEYTPAPTEEKIDPALAGISGTLITSLLALAGVAAPLVAITGAVVTPLITTAITDANKEYQDRNDFYKETVAAKYNTVQSNKDSIIQQGSQREALQEYETAESEAEKSDTLLGKMKEIDAIQNKFSDAAGAAYNARVEKALDEKLAFLQNNEDILMQIHTAVGDNAGINEAAKINAETRAMKALVENSPVLDQALKNNDTRLIESLFLQAQARAGNLYDATPESYDKQQMDKNTFYRIAKTDEGDLGHRYMIHQTMGLGELKDGKAGVGGSTINSIDFAEADPELLRKWEDRATKGYHLAEIRGEANLLKNPEGFSTSEITDDDIANVKNCIDYLVGQVNPSEFGFAYNHSFDSEDIDLHSKGLPAFAVEDVPERQTTSNTMHFTVENINVTERPDVEELASVIFTKMCNNLAVLR